MIAGSSDTTDRRVRVWQKARRYALAGIGPVGTALAHFVLSLVMLRSASPAAFGTFTFLFVVAQLSWGVWSALFCAPLPVVMASADPGERETAARSFIAASSLAALLTLAPFLLLALSLDLRLASALVFALYGGLALVRWFARALAYVRGRQMRTVASDVLYGAGLMIVLAGGRLVLEWPAELSGYVALLAGAVLGLAPFAGEALARRPSLALSVLRGYGRVWRAHARWALVGVLTTEMTANAHVYLITVLKGPAAFAPIAAASLLLRPVNIAQNALMEFERPQMAAQIGAGRIAAVRDSLFQFRLALAAIWVGTGLAACAVLFAVPHLLFPKSYDLGEVAAATGLWALFAALRFLQTPESTLLQAAGAFRPLALASVWSSLVSVGLVLGLVYAMGALASMWGLIAGAVVYLYWTLRRARLWLREASAVPSTR